MNGVWYKEDGTKPNILEKVYIHIGLIGLIKERELRERA